MRQRLRLRHRFCLRHWLRHRLLLLLERLHLDLLLLQLRVVLPRRLCVVAEYELLLNLHFRRLRTKQRSRTSRSPRAKSKGSVLTTGLGVCACCWGTVVPAVMP